jgi:hypothetical protein
MLLSILFSIIIFSGLVGFAHKKNSIVFTLVNELDDGVCRTAGTNPTHLRIGMVLLAG